MGTKVEICGVQFGELNGATGEITGQPLPDLGPEEPGTVYVKLTNPVKGCSYVRINRTHLREYPVFKTVVSFAREHGTSLEAARTLLSASPLEFHEAQHRVALKAMARADTAEEARIADSIEE